MFPLATVAAIEAAAREATGWPDCCCWTDNNKDNLFRLLFGCSPLIAAELWERCSEIDDDGEKTVAEM